MFHSYYFRWQPFVFHGYNSKRQPFVFHGQNLKRQPFSFLTSDYLNSKILIKTIIPSPISTIKLNLYSFNSTIKPKPKHVFHGFNFVFHGFKYKHGNPLCFTITILDGNPLCSTVTIPIDNLLCSTVTISNSNPSAS